MTSEHSHGASQAHSHGQCTSLAPEAAAVLTRGIERLIEMTRGLDFAPLPSEKYPLPLTAMVYGDVPRPDDVRADILERLHTDPVSVLESALVLLELYESNQDDAASWFLEDMPFLGACFASKRRNGWIRVVGDADAEAVENLVNSKWQFKFYSTPSRSTGIYSLLNTLARYGFVYGRIPFGDAHAMGHFIEEHTPGVLVCHGSLSELELALSLAAMKMGVPAIVPVDYPFPLGRTIRADRLDEISDAVVAFPNVRRLLRTSEIPQMPAYASEDNVDEQFEPALVWGDTPESFFIVRKGMVNEPGVFVDGVPAGPLGVIITVDAEPMDAFDRKHIEQTISLAPSMMKGVKASFDGQRLQVSLAAGVTLQPERLGEVIMAALRREFPRITSIRADIVFDSAALSAMLAVIDAEKAQRAGDIKSATEESVDDFVTCVGCSPFAPDHVCVLTPERAPQCGRSYGQIKTGALYGYDDMSNIHHSALHREINSFGIIAKGDCIDPVRGEYSGVNERASALTGGRTTRIQLHCLDECPTTGCGCFNLVMFKTDKPRPGIAIMDNACKGHAPDGRTWRDLHYSLAGKQTPGIAGASAPYLLSPRFLQAHGGWSAVVWVTPRIAQIMADRIPSGVEVGD